MKKRILSGMRPTGRLHIGHYAGVLANWIDLQDEYENFHLIADYHNLTTDLNTSEIYDDSIEMVADWLSAGLDPQKNLIFRQSQIKEHTELFLIFSMLITSSRLERNPTLKDQIRDLNVQNLIYGHLGYPVLQAADILIYKGNLVPVGEDQVPHVEITREIARRFNQQFGEVFPEPEPKVNKYARLPGLDGTTKMSKSLDNTIMLTEPLDKIQTKIKKAFTDPLKLRKGDPGRPEICLIFTYHTKFNPEEIPEIEKNCRSGALGCVECKKNCGNKIFSYLEPIREKRIYYESHMDEVHDIIKFGEIEARKVAQQTMSEVRNAMKLG